MEKELEEMKKINKIADMLLELMVMSGDDDAILMKQIHKLFEKVKKISNYFTRNIDNAEKKEEIKQFTLKMHKEFDDFMKEEGITYGNQDNK